MNMGRSGGKTMFAQKLTSRLEMHWKLQCKFTVYSVYRIFILWSKLSNLHTVNHQTLCFSGEESTISQNTVLFLEWNLNLFHYQFESLLRFYTTLALPALKCKCSPQGTNVFSIIKIELQDIQWFLLMKMFDYTWELFLKFY